MKFHVSDRTKSFIWVCVLAGLIVPVVVHLAFKNDAPADFLIPAWSAGDFLQYFAGLLGAFATLVAVLLTIEDENAARLEEQRLAIVPMITISLVEHGVTDLVANARDCSSSNDMPFKSNGGHQAASVSDVGFIVVDKNGSIAYRSALSDEQVAKASNRPFIDTELSPGLIATIANDGHLHLLKLVSVGNGPAINVTVFFEVNGETPLFEGAPLQLPTMQLLVGDSAYVGILFENFRSIESHGDYWLVIRYHDATSTHHYEQRHKVGVHTTIDEGRSAFQLEVDLKIEQRLIKDGTA